MGVFLRIEDCEGGVVLYLDNYGMCDFTFGNESVSFCAKFSIAKK
jgi:hypothetical protein